MKIEWRHPFESVRERFFYHLSRCSEQLNEVRETRSAALAREISETRSRIRAAAGKPAHVVFVCHRPAFWPHLKSLFESCVADPVFQVTIVAVPCLIRFPDQDGKEVYDYESQGAEEFFKDFPCRVLQGYDYEKHTWLDLKSLEADYLFFQTPYNNYRPAQYHARIVSRYVQICHVFYGIDLFAKGGLISQVAGSFLRYTSFIFSKTPWFQRSYQRAMASFFPDYEGNRIFLAGSAALDAAKMLRAGDSKLWRHKREEGYFRILWTPRWNDDQHVCTFAYYHDWLREFAERSHCDLVFRPHPRAFGHYPEAGIATKEQLEQLVKDFENSQNCRFNPPETSLSTEAIASSDVLVTDPSGVFFEYFVTGKPVVYCERNNDWANDFARKLFLEGAYCVKNESEMEETLNMLAAGNDPLKEKRKALIRSEFYFPPEGAGVKIKNILKEHYSRQ